MIFIYSKEPIILIQLFIMSEDNKPQQKPQSNLKNGHSKVKQISQETKIKKKISKPNKNKSIVHQIIDLQIQNHGLKQTQSTQRFITQLSKKCSIFFNWISNPKSDALAEQLWKTQKLQYATQMYGQLNNYQLQKIVDRDWKYMPQQQRKRIIEIYKISPDISQLEESIANFTVMKH